MAKQLPTNLVFIFVLALGISSLACTKQKLALYDTNLAGEYTLISVNGESVPASVSHGGVALRVLSGRFTIASDGTCKSQTVFVSPSGAESAREVTATYTTDGAKLTMRWQGAGTTVGTVQADTFTMDNEGMLFVYKR